MSRGRNSFGRLGLTITDRSSRAFVRLTTAPHTRVHWAADGIAPAEMVWFGDPGDQAYLAEVAIATSTTRLSRARSNAFAM